MQFSLPKPSLPDWAGKLFPTLTRRKKAGAEAPSIRLACDFGKSKIVFLEVETLGGVMTLNKFHKTARAAEKI